MLVCGQLYWERTKITFSSELSTSCTFGSTAEGAEKASPETNLKGGPNTGGWTPHQVSEFLG